MPCQMVGGLMYAPVPLPSETHQREKYRNLLLSLSIGYQAVSYRYSIHRIIQHTWMSGADKFPTATCDAYGDFRNAPAVRPAELKIDGAFSSPFVRASESTPPFVRPGGNPRFNAYRRNKKRAATESERRWRASQRGNVRGRLIVWRR